MGLQDEGPERQAQQMGTHLFWKCVGLSSSEQLHRSASPRHMQRVIFLRQGHRVRDYSFSPATTHKEAMEEQAMKQEEGLREEAVVSRRR